MRNPRHLFILVGFFAQALTWDSYIVLAAVFGIWLGALSVRGRFAFSLRVEALVLVLGCAASILLNKALGRSSHFFLGDGLILLQAARLMRPLNKREKLTSVIVAAFHFGVLCTLAPNIRFVVLYVGAMFLFPGALKEISAGFADTAKRPLEIPDAFRFLPSARVCLWLLLGSAFVFVTFPRFTGTPLQLREGLGDQGSLLDSILDPRRGGRANSQQVLLQIEGDHIGYMRCLALTEFDGVRWAADRSSKLMRMRFVPRSEFEKYKGRTVYVKNSQYLGRVLPVDGKPVHIDGNFMSHPFVSPHGVIECSVMVTTGNNVYTYYIDPEPAAEKLSPRLRDHLTWHPPQSEALRLWVEDKTSGGTNLYQKARLLQKYLRDNFSYEIGTPELNRLAPVDDFVFNRRSGHCERFAASLALMLRMQGIPTRVSIGYVPTTRNLFNGRAQVRFRDAHSWTEAYFDDVGWVQLDATPGPPPSGTGSDLLDLIDALDFAWYSHVVNFNGFAQKELFQASREVLAKVPAGAWGTLQWGAVVLLGLAAAARWLKIPAVKIPLHWRRNKRSIAAAKHYYEQMLRQFEAQNILKSAGETPNEFAAKLGDHPKAREAALITSRFCESYYGGSEPTKADLQEIESALKNLKTRRSN